jgi:hypothetical protein
MTCFAESRVEDTLHAFARAGVDIPWIFANQEGDRPPRPYGTLHMLSVIPIGMGDVKIEDLLGDPDHQLVETMRDTFDLDVSIQIMGNGARVMLAALHTYARRPSTTIGSKEGLVIGFMRASLIRDLPAVAGPGWEPRAQCDFRFSARFDCELLIDSVAGVDIHGAGSTQRLEVP